jgi:hypothetical protein
MRWRALPLALIPVNGQKPEISGQNSDRQIAAAHAPEFAGLYNEQMKDAFNNRFNRPLS